LNKNLLPQSSCHIHQPQILQALFARQKSHQLFKDETSWSTNQSHWEYNLGWPFERLKNDNTAEITTYSCRAQGGLNLLKKTQTWHDRMESHGYSKLGRPSDPIADHHWKQMRGRLCHLLLKMQTFKMRLSMYMATDNNLFRELPGEKKRETSH
jgi:hypothetical protein